MTEHPTLFSAPKVRAILVGAKTQARQIVKPQPPTVAAVRAISGSDYHLADLENSGLWRVMGPVWAVRQLRGDRADRSPKWRCPFGVRGDRLWVREAFYCDDHTAGDFDRARAGYVGKHPTDAEFIEQWRAALEYHADHDCTTWEAGCPCADDEGRRMWKPAICMPRWASRITLEVTDVRVQRLHDISDDDARAEGVTPYTPPHGHISTDQRVPGPGFDNCRLGAQPHRLSFADLWDQTHGKRDLWAENPWVWAITFKGVTS